MKRIYPFVALGPWAAVGILACASWAQQPPAGGAAPVEASQSEIHGTVISATTGEPLRGAPVILNGSRRGMGRGRGGGVNEVVLSGSEGQFAFAGLAPGEYAIYAQKTGYETQRGPRSAAQISLGSDEIRKDVTVRLQPSAVVSGRVLDAFGEPLPEAQVFAMARFYFAGTTRWRLLQSATTDDVGDYRLHGLGAGRYILAAVPSGGLSPRGVGYREFAAMFYPNAFSSSEATPLRLTWGMELTGMDFRLVQSAETTLQGVVTEGSTGEPCADCYIGLDGEDSLAGPSVTATKEGLFVLQGVAPGSYWLVAQRRGRDSGFAAEQVVIPQSGVVGVKLVLGEGQTVSGEVVLEDPPDPPPQEGRERGREQPFAINLEGERMHMRGQTRTTAPAGGGAFELEKTPPGDYLVRVRARGGYLRAVSLGGRPLAAPEIMVPGDAPLAGLKLHIAFDGATIDGTVKTSSGDEELQALGRFVAVIPEGESQERREQLRFPVQPDGRFHAEGIAPGRYTLYAEGQPGTLDVGDPETQRALERYAKKVTLAKGEKLTVELTCSPDLP